MSSPQIGIPTIVTSAGAVPATPQALQTTLLANATALSPGLTGNLPGTLIEDVASTAVGALTVIDSAYVDLINSISATTANPFILVQLGALYGVAQGIGSNASVFVVFSGPAGFPINTGFQVGDGTNQYTVQDGGVIGAGGLSAALFCIAVQSGTFAIPANTVTKLVTSVPSGYAVTCNNPTAGLPAVSAQTIAQYQGQVIAAGLSTAQGMPQFLKTQIGKVAGVSPRLISVQQSGAQWIVVVGGGDPYQVGYAIYTGIGDISSLAGVTLAVLSISNATNAAVITTIAHGYTTGQTATINGAGGITGVNGVAFTVTVTGPNSFTTGLNTLGSGTYTGGGFLFPNPRVQNIAINDYPDTYTVAFVIPLQQLVGIALTWSSGAMSFTNSAAIAQLATPALVTYVNSLFAGQPLNLYEMQGVFKKAIASLLSPELITSMTWAITINGVSASPAPGTQVFPGDPFSYFETFPVNVSVVQA